MRHGSLFSGIGGFDLAAEWMGWENVFHCEKNPFGQRVLKYYWPNAILYDDVKEADFSIHRGKIDILTGGFPCQPYSAAGKRKGKEDDRHLWPYMLGAIRAIQPRWVVGENVLGLVNWSKGLVFHEVQSDLEAEGYEVFPYVLPACSQNAPHRRDRVWFVAYRNATNPNGTKSGNNLGANDGEEKEVRRGNKGDVLRGLSEFGDAANPESQQSERIGPKLREVGETEQGELGGSDCGGGGKFPKGNWDNFPTTQPTIRKRDDGFSRELVGITFPKWRNESIMAYGNAVVPQVVFEIFKAIELYETTTRIFHPKADL